MNRREKSGLPARRPSLGAFDATGDVCPERMLIEYLGHSTLVRFVLLSVFRLGKVLFRFDGWLFSQGFKEVAEARHFILQCFKPVAWVPNFNTDHGSNNNKLLSCCDP